MGNPDLLERVQFGDTVAMFINIEAKDTIYMGYTLKNAHMCFLELPAQFL